MLIEIELEAGTIGPEVTPSREVPMVRQERWEEIRRLAFRERVAIAEIARRLELDRKTVRRCLRDQTWTAYHRPLRADTVLAPHLAYLRERAPRVGYSAQILFQELRQQRGYRGSYDTVKLFVRPLRAAGLSSEQTVRRFETPPGQQSQIDWGTATVPFRARPRWCTSSSSPWASAGVASIGASPTRRCPSSSMPTSRPSPTSAATLGNTSMTARAPSTRAWPAGASCGIPPSAPFADYWSFEP